MVLSDDFYYQPIRLDTINTQIYTDLIAKEGDAGGRGLKVTITENGVTKNTTGITLNLKWEHTAVADLQGLEPFEAVDLTKGIYKLKYPTNMLHKGTVKALIQIIDNGGLAGSRNLKIKVDSTVGDDTAMESSNEFTALVTALVKTNHMENLLKETIANVTVDSEVITARNSTAKQKTFTVLDERMEDLEKDVYYPANNELTQADLAATTGWSVYQGTLAVANNVASVTGTSGLYPNVYQDINCEVGDKLYYAAQARVTTAGAAAIALRSEGVEITTDNARVLTPVANQWYQLDCIKTAFETTPSFAVSQRYALAADATGKVLQVKKPIALNLTKIFGANAIPTIEQIRAILSRFTDSHFVGNEGLSQPALLMGKALSLEAQFNAAVAGLTVDDETINARVGKDNTTHATLKARLDSEKSTIDQSLVSLGSQLAENTTVLQGIDKTFGDITFATLVALQTAYPTGDTKRYIVAADGKWYYWSGSAWAAGQVAQAIGIPDRGIIEQKLAFSPAKVSLSKNLFNRKTVTSGYYINAFTQVVTADANYSYSDYIPVYGSTAYCRITATHTLFYDKDKVYISGTTSKTFTTPANAVYIRISLTNTTLYTEQLELGSINTAYESYGATLAELKDSSIPQTKLGSLTIKKENIKGFESSSNLFNIANATRGYLSHLTNGEVATVGWNTSEYVEILPSQKYIVSYAVGDCILFYDENDVALSRLSVPTPTIGYIFTTPVNAKYVRVNMQDVKIDAYMLVLGEVLPTEFVPYVSTIDWLTFKDESIKKENLESTLQVAINTKWNGKKIVTFGDSITWYDEVAFQNTHIEYGQVAKGYQSYMREKLGCIVDNQGYSGAHIKLISSSKIKGYPSYADVDAVTLTSGANDHRIGFAPGSVQPIGSAFNLDTYAGAFQDAIEYLLAQKPSLKIYLITPIKGWFTAETTTRYNGEKIISETYVNIMLQIAKLYSLPILDWYHTSGINDLNYYVNGEPYYIGDNPAVWTAYQLHPTQIGFGKMADMLIPFLNNN